MHHRADRRFCELIAYHRPSMRSPEISDLTDPWSAPAAGVYRSETYKGTNLIAKSVRDKFCK